MKQTISIHNENIYIIKIGIESIKKNIYSKSIKLVNRICILELSQVLILIKQDKV